MMKKVLMPGNKRGWGIVLGWLVMNCVLLGSCSPVENSFIRTPSMLAPQGPVAAEIEG